MFWIPKSTPQLDTTTSLAAIPAIRATMICQYPSPTGAKNGTIALPIQEPKLKLMSVTYPDGPKFNRTHITTDARKITVPARVK